MPVSRKYSTPPALVCRWIGLDDPDRFVPIRAKAVRPDGNNLSLWALKIVTQRSNIIRTVTHFGGNAGMQCRPTPLLPAIIEAAARKFEQPSRIDNEIPLIGRRL